MNMFGMMYQRINILMIIRVSSLNSSNDEGIEISQNAIIQNKKPRIEVGAFEMKLLGLWIVGRL